MTIIHRSTRTHNTQRLFSLHHFIICLNLPQSFLSTQQSGRLVPTRFAYYIKIGVSFETPNHQLVLSHYALFLRLTTTAEPATTAANAMGSAPTLPVLADVLSSAPGVVLPVLPVRPLFVPLEPVVPEVFL
jgi:hypothetical protein